MSITALPHDIDLTPPKELVHALRKCADELRMLPAVAMEALQIVKKPECSISEFTAVVRRDVKLTADILKIANSALYSPVSPVLDLNRCVLRVGFRECQYLILAASIASLMNRVSMADAPTRETLWRHSFTTALLATRINRALKLGFEGEEFTAGLLHDFGRFLVAITMPEEFADFDPLNFEESPEMLLQEFEVAGTDHCRLGAWFARNNQLPPAIVSVILHHHEPELAEQHQRLAALIAVADHLANHLQRFGDSDEELTLPPAFSLLLENQADDQAAGAFWSSIPALLRQAQSDADAMLWN